MRGDIKRPWWLTKKKKIKIKTDWTPVRVAKLNEEYKNPNDKNPFSQNALHVLCQKQKNHESAVKQNEKPEPIRKKPDVKVRPKTLGGACARCRKTWCILFVFGICDFRWRCLNVTYRVSGSQSKEESIVERSIGDRLMSTWPRVMNTDGFRRFSCRQESQRPPDVLTRPRQPRGWFTHEYILKV